LALSSKKLSIVQSIIEFRQKHGLSQQALAKELGVCRTTVWRWEHGKTTVPQIMPVTLRGLAMILHARKSERRRKQRKRLIALQGNEYERQKALQQMPKHIRDALNVRDEN